MKTKIIEALVFCALFLFVVPSLVAPVSCSSPVPMGYVDLYPHIGFIIISTAGLIIGVIIVFGKELITHENR
jgi:hypothetical protein